MSTQQTTPFILVPTLHRELLPDGLPTSVLPVWPGLPRTHDKTHARAGDNWFHPDLPYTPAQAAACLVAFSELDEDSLHRVGTEDCGSAAKQTRLQAERRRESSDLAQFARTGTVTVDASAPSRDHEESRRWAQRFLLLGWLQEERALEMTALLARYKAGANNLAAHLGDELGDELSDELEHFQSENALLTQARQPPRSGVDSGEKPTQRVPRRGIAVGECNEPYGYREQRDVFPQNDALKHSVFQKQNALDKPAAFSEEAKGMGTDTLHPERELFSDLLNAMHDLIPEDPATLLPSWRFMLDLLAMLLPPEVPLFTADVRLVSALDAAGLCQEALSDTLLAQLGCHEAPEKSELRDRLSLTCGRLPLWNILGKEPERPWLDSPRLLVVCHPNLERIHVFPAR